MPPSPGWQSLSTLSTLHLNGRLTWRQRATPPLSPKRLLGPSHTPALAKGTVCLAEVCRPAALKRPGPTRAGASNGPAQLSGLLPKSLADTHPKEVSQELHEPQ